MQLLPISVDSASKERVAERPIILLIEDHAATRNVLFHLLELQGYRAVCTANGQEALEWIEKALLVEQYPAVILLDLFMPVMNGSRFLACLCAQWQTSMPLPPVILLTGDQNRHNHLLCTEVLGKPFHMSDLLEKLRLVIGKGQDGASQVEMQAE